MSVYSNLQIRQAIESGQLVCHPFLPTQLGSTSLAVTLGYHYYRIERLHTRTVYNPFDREEVERYFDGPYRALPHQEWCLLNGLKPLGNIPLDHPVISLRPGERILAHSHEFLGINAPGAAAVRPRSMWERNGIAVSAQGGWINPGQPSRLTLEIHNRNERETVLLPVGERIAQITFHETGKVDPASPQPRDSRATGSSNNLDVIIRTWSPDMLLPTAYRDQRTIPTKIEGLAYE